MRAPIFTILVDGVAATATKRAMEEVNVAVDGDVPPAYILRKFFFFFWVPIYVLRFNIYIYIYIYIVFLSKYCFGLLNSKFTFCLHR